MYQPIRKFIPCSQEEHYTGLTLIVKSATWKRKEPKIPSTSTSAFFFSFSGVCVAILSYGHVSKISRDDGLLSDPQCKGMAFTLKS